MKIFALLSVLLGSVNASADVFSYRLYESSVREYTPFVLSISMDGAFTHGSRITQVTLKEVLKNKTTVLFVWNKELLGKVFKFSWKGNALVMEARKNAPNFKAVVKKSVSNPWGDTDINSKDWYSLFLEEPISLTANSVSPDARFEIGNQTVEEACLFGELTK